MLASLVAMIAVGVLPTSVAAAAPGAAEPEPGDIVLRRGNGLWSAFFAWLNRRDGRFSHVGVVVRDGTELKVAHAEADDNGMNGEVRLTGWRAFEAASRQLIVLRLHDRAAADRVAEAALSLHAARPAFDLDFDLADAAAVYCSELAWRALTIGLGRDPLPEKPLLGGRPVVLIENFLLDIPELRVVGP